VLREAWLQGREPLLREGCRHANCMAFNLGVGVPKKEIIETFLNGTANMNTKVGM
jgi:hypothetical protein